MYRSYSCLRNEEQKKKYLPKLATGEYTLGAWGLTEPNTGSDAMRMQCTAEDKGDHFLVNGMKTWITHGLSGDVAVVLIRTGDLLDSNGITAFIVEKGMKGFTANKIDKKMGVRASQPLSFTLTMWRFPKKMFLAK